MNRTILLVAAAAALIAWRGGLGSADDAPPLRIAKSDASEPPAVEVERDGAPGVLLGDASLQGSIDLTKAGETDGHYEVELDGGKRAVLTLDPAMQKAAENVVARAKAPYAAIVVMAPDGRLLALAGRSNADEKPQDFELPLKVWAPAASVFKVITASALLAAGVEPDREVCYHGGVRSVDASHLEDDPKRDGTCHDLAFGVAKSQNAIIGKLAHRHLDAAKLEKVARAFGFGDAPTFALPADASRCELPDEPLEFARVAAGFWHTEVSPLGGALIANTIASGGLEVTPRIVASVIDRDGVETHVVGVAPRRAIDEDVAAKVAEMMTGTTSFGTASPGFHDKRGRRYLDVDVAGKTGSLSRTEPEYLGYSWFVGFAPADEPQIAIAVLLGNSPKWQLKAHTAARLVLERVL
jgi:cell division protein FtsI/penicillin-binding protein 2